jgi:hypothetical protein
MEAQGFHNDQVRVRACETSRVKICLSPLLLFAFGLMAIGDKRVCRRGRPTLTSNWAVCSGLVYEPLRNCAVLQS